MTANGSIAMEGEHRISFSLFNQCSSHFIPESSVMC